MANKIVHPIRGSGALTFRNVTCRFWVTIVDYEVLGLASDGRRYFWIFFSWVTWYEFPGRCLCRSRLSVVHESLTTDERRRRRHRSFVGELRRIGSSVRMITSSFKDG